jgi:phosphotransacetylase
VAALAAVEVVYPQMPVTMEAAVLAKMADRGQIKKVALDGPLSFDVAVDGTAASAKGITNSAVAGKANAFLAPNAEVAFGIYSALSLFADASGANVIVGGRVPVATAIRSDSEESRYQSLALACLLVE